MSDIELEAFEDALNEIGERVSELAAARLTDDRRNGRGQLRKFSI